MNCRQVKDGLPLFVGDDLTEAERTQLEQHLDGCADCRVQLERFRSVFAPLRGIAPVDAPVPDAELLWKGITRGMGWDQDAAPKRPARLPLAPWARTFLGVAAVFCLGLGLGYLSTLLPTRHDGGRPELAAARPDFSHLREEPGVAVSRTLPTVGDFTLNDVQPVDNSPGAGRRFYMWNIFPEGKDRAPAAERENRFHLEQIRTVHGEELIAGY